MISPNSTALDRDQHGDAAAPDDAGEHVAAVAVAPQDVGRVVERRHFLEAGEALVGIGDRQELGEGDAEEQDDEPPGGQVGAERQLALGGSALRLFDDDFGEGVAAVGVAVGGAQPEFGLVRLLQELAHWSTVLVVAHIDAIVDRSTPVSARHFVARNENERY